MIAKQFIHCRVFNTGPIYKYLSLKKPQKSVGFLIRNLEEGPANPFPPIGANARHQHFPDDAWFKLSRGFAYRWYMQCVPLDVAAF